MCEKGVLQGPFSREKKSKITFVGYPLTKVSLLEKLAHNKFIEIPPPHTGVRAFFMIFDFIRISDFVKDFA